MSGFLMLLHSLTNFEIQKYCKKKPKFYGVYSRSNLPNIKNGTYVINLQEYKSTGAHWIAFDVNGDNLAYFDSFGVEDVPKEIKKFIDNKNIKYL